MNGLIWHYGLKNYFWAKFQFLLYMKNPNPYSFFRANIKTALGVSTFVAVIFTFTSCALIFLPHRQKITIRTQNDSTIVYYDHLEAGMGKMVTAKTAKSGAKQITLKTPGYKDQYEVVMPGRKPIMFWPLFAIDMMTFYGGLFDLGASASINNYPKFHNFASTGKLTYREPNEKYIDMEAITLDIKDISKDLQDYYLTYTENMEKEFEKAEDKRAKQISKAEEKAANKKKKDTKTLSGNTKEMKADDTRFSESVYKTLRITGYVDTVNKVFRDPNNMLELQGAIRKGSVFIVSGKAGSSYQKAKLQVIWFIKNSYGEKVDSIEMWSYSGDFSRNSGTFSPATMFGDAVDNAFQELLKNERFTSRLKLDTNFQINAPLLTIPMPKNVVTDANDATLASVIVKRKDKGHGSGFAISNDGYILTNYHVIAGDVSGKPTEFTIVTANGEELKAEVVRYNTARDIALLKVNATFEKAFALSNTKSFKRLMEVYAVGTPKSIELGQSVSLGILSNERKTNNNNLLQLSMSINSGNSGGPLFDKTGVLHGVVTSKLVGFSTEGVGFAIPSYMIPSYLNLAVK